MKSKKRQYSILLILSVFFLTFSMSIGTTMLAPQLAQAQEKAPPAKCPEPKPVTIDIPTSALLMLHWQNDLIKPEGKLSLGGKGSKRITR